MLNILVMLILTIAAIGGAANVTSGLVIAAVYSWPLFVSLVLWVNKENGGGDWILGVMGVCHGVVVLCFEMNDDAQSDPLALMIYFCRSTVMLPFYLGIWAWYTIGR